MKTPVPIRRAKLDDIVATARLYRSVRTTCLPFLPALHAPTDDIAFFERQVFPNWDVWVTGDPDICGFCALRPGWIEQLYVEPTQHGRGIGGAFVAMAKQSATELRLWTFQRNAQARAFYEARGFALVELTDGDNNEEREPDALYCWRASDPPSRQSQLAKRKCNTSPSATT